MSYSRNDSSGCEAIGCLASLVFGLIIPLVQFFIEKSVYKNVNFLYSVIAILAVISILISIRCHKLHNKCTNLSPTAQEFAKRLGVIVKVEPLGDFPLIKCNINNESKIYHMPFDQQYWRTKIENPGEFYASTVAEAVKRGFRRAFKHKLNS